MAETEHSAASAHQPQADSELTIKLRPYDCSMWELQGTRAQLEAEGVIPAGTNWPATGVRCIRWKSGVLRFELHRTRPPGLKGPMRLWMSSDCWTLRSWPLTSPHHLEQRVIDALRKLKEECYWASPAGQRAWNEQWDRHRAAERDSAFQAFKALIPALNRPQGRRRAGGKDAGPAMSAAG